MAKFLDDKGVSKLWNKIKSVFATKNEVNNKANKNHKQAYFAAECDTYTADDNIGITAAAAKKCVNTFALGKTETAVKAQGLVDTGDGRIITARYSNNGSPNPSYYAVWSDATITYASKEEVKNNLGINNLATKSELTNLNDGVNELGLEVQGQGSDITSLQNNKAEKSELSTVHEQVITNTSEIQQRIMKAELSFSLSGSTLTITKRY